MNNELDHSKHPIKLSIFWAIVYTFIATSILFGMSIVADQYRTHIIPTGSVALTIPYSKYTVGEKINFTIKNNYNSSIYIINNCPSEPLAVYKQIDGKWVLQHDQASTYECPTEQRQIDIKAGETMNGSFAPWPNLFSQPGKYRIVAFVEYYNALPYQDIEVVQVTAKVPSAPTTNPTTYSNSNPNPQSTSTGTNAGTSTTNPTTNIQPENTNKSDNESKDD